MKFTFIKLPSHRRFNPRNIYYDENKAEQKDRERRIREELGLEPAEDDSSTIEDRVRGRMRRRIKTSFDITHSARRKSNIRLIIILMALMGLFYYLLRAGHEWYSNFL